MDARRGNRGRGWAAAALLVLIPALAACSSEGGSSTHPGPLPSPSATAATVAPSTATRPPTSAAATITATPSGEPSPSPSAEPSASASASRQPQQLRYQLNIADERGTLRGGSAFASRDLSGNTGHAIPYNAVICGIASRRCAGASTPSAAPSGSPAPGSVPEALPPGLGDVPIGARIRAKLTAADPAIEIRELTSDAIQPIIEDEDAAEWEWTITATAEGSYRLSLRFDVLSADSDQLILPSQTFRITLTATTTTADMLRNLGRDTWDAIATVTGLIATIGGAGLFSAIAWTWRRVRRRRALAIAPTAASTPPTDTP